jgi:non-ribosomal peptide synthetase component F
MLSKLRLWISSGEVLTKSLALDFFSYYTTKGENILVNFYGATEALDCTVYEISSEKQLENLNKIPIGLPVHNTMMYVINFDTKEPVENGESGEICVSGLNLADGYVNGRALYVFMENIYSNHEIYSRLYHTGDWGSIRNGMLYYEGRDDLQVKINGKNFFLFFCELTKKINH